MWILDALSICAQRRAQVKTEEFSQLKDSRYDNAAYAVMQHIKRQGRDVNPKATCCTANGKLEL